MNSGQLQGETRLCRRGDVDVYGLDGELLIHDPVMGGVHRLNSSARLIWEQCDGRSSEQDIAQAVTERFDVTLEDATLHVVETVPRLSALGLLEHVEMCD